VFTPSLLRFPFSWTLICLLEFKIRKLSELGLAKEENAKYLVVEKAISGTAFRCMSELKKLLSNFNSLALLASHFDYV